MIWIFEWIKQLFKQAETFELSPREPSTMVRGSVEISSGRICWNLEKYPAEENPYFPLWLV